MNLYKYKGKRIRASDKNLVYRFCVSTLLFLFVFDFSAKGLLDIVANGIKSLCFFLGGLVLVVKLVFLFDKLLHFRLQRLVAR